MFSLSNGFDALLEIPALDTEVTQFDLSGLDATCPSARAVFSCTSTNRLLAFVQRCIQLNDMNSSSSSCLR